MIFIAPTTRRQHERMWIFESFRFWRDERTGQLVIMWRRNRCLSFFFGFVLFLYFGSVAAGTWWLQLLSPGVPVTYGQMLNPVHWLSVPHIWNNYQRTLAEQSRQLEKTPASTSAAAQPSNSHPSAPSATPPQSANDYGTLLTQFFAHNGGVTKLLGIHSIQIQGTVTLPDGNTKNFTLTKKLPDKVRLNIHDNLSTSENTVLTNGHDTWVWGGDPYVNGVRPAIPSEASAILREALYTDVAVAAIQRPHDITESTPPGDSAPAFVLQLPDGMRAQVFPDPKTWLPSRIQINYDQDGHPNTCIIAVREWMTVEGVPEPSSFDVTLNDAPLLQCHINRIVYNLGVYDILFEPPLGASTAAAPSPAAVASHPKPG
jgi:hypothetical protein